MSLRRKLPQAAGVAALVALAAPASGFAAGDALPTVERTLTTQTSHARTSWVAPMSGYVTVRTSAAKGTDFDATLVDAASGRSLATSRSFSSNEVLQAWVTAGQRLTVKANRVGGKARRLNVAFELFDADLPETGERVSLVEVAFKDNADLERIEQAGLDLTHHIHDGKADVLVSGAEQFGVLRKLGLKHTVEIADMDVHARRARKADARYAAKVAEEGSGLPSGRTTYRTYPDIQRELKDLVARYPGLAKSMTLPKKTFQGRDIEGIEITRNVAAADDGKPTYFLMGVHHAREWPSAEAAMEFAYMVLQRAGKDQRIDALLDSARIVVVPVLNIDGYLASRGAVSPGDATGNSLVQTAEAIMPPGGYLAYRRKNCNGAIPSGAVPCELQYGIDPNRNYGNGWGGRGAGTDVNTQSYRGPGPWSEPETQAVHEFSQRNEVTGLITLHTVAALVLRPPGRSLDGKAPDENGLKALGDAMGRATGYESQYSFQLYDTSGTTEDWNYAAAGTYGYTIEIGPKNGQFHMPYQTGVVRQWTGEDLELDEDAPRGLGEALLLSAEAAADASKHGVIQGSAPAGRTLRIRKDFETKTSKICAYAQGYVNSTAFSGALEQAKVVNCAYELPEQTIPDFLEMTTKVPASGEFEWHVNQSTRPFVGWKYDDATKQAVDTGKREQYKLTCEDDRGQVLETVPVTVDPGEKAHVRLTC